MVEKQSIHLYVYFTNDQKLSHLLRPPPPPSTQPRVKTGKRMSLPSVQIERKEVVSKIRISTKTPFHLSKTTGQAKLKQSDDKMKRLSQKLVNAQ